MRKRLPSQGHVLSISYLKRFVKSGICVFLALFMVVPAHAALPSDEILDMFDTNGIYYYNPDGDNGCVSTSTTLRGDNVTEKMWNFFIEQGFNDAQVAGILGNAQAESNFGVTRSSTGSYWGVFQWGGGRKDKLFAKIEEAGLGKYLSSEYWPSGADKKIPDADIDKLLQIELEHTMSEEDYDWKNELKKSNTPEEAAEIFLVLFERAVNGETEIMYYAPFVGLMYQGTEKRRSYAADLYKQYSGNGTTSSSSPTATKGSDVTVIGDSLSVGATQTFYTKFPELSSSNLNALSGRKWAEGISEAQNMNLQDIVVFALGSNSPNLTQADIDAAIAAVGNDRKIVFVTNYGPVGYDSNNKLMKQAAANNPNVIIADWATTVDQSPEMYLAPDGLHLNSAGNKLFVETIFKAINSNTNDNGCSVTGEFSTLVLGYAWPEYHAPQYVERMPAYAEAVTISQSEGRYVGGSVAGVPGIDCGGFVTILTQNSGLEPLYNTGPGGKGIAGATTGQENWVINNGWTLVNGSNTTPVDTSALQAGDIAFSGGTGPAGNGHTFIYVGEIAGFDSVIASASYSTNGTSGRAPMAGREDLIYSGGTAVRWYRKN
ncbi:MAG: phage tail tip lysozyme [Candidatus Saccharimonadales bacterium]